MSFSLIIKKKLKKKNSLLGFLENNLKLFSLGLALRPVRVRVLMSVFECLFVCPHMG